MKLFMRMTKTFSTTGIRCIIKSKGNFGSKVFISYFSYHKPIVSFLEYDTNANESEQYLPE
jgi:hypothetical protein